MITKEQFYAAYNKHLPSKLEVFCFKYFSTSTLQQNRWLMWAITGFLFIPFLISFIFAVLGKPDKVVAIPGTIFVILLLIFLIPRSYAWIAHKIRINKIRKELGVTKAEYDTLENMYF